jgi:Mn2+/Fe2+ NRAMP family transporter
MTDRAAVRRLRWPSPRSRSTTALVVTAVINGILAVPLLVLVMLVANNRVVMGERTNGRRLNVLGWGTTAVMGIAAMALIVTTIAG